jgi:hypothetical protein
MFLAAAFASRDATTAANSREKSQDDLRRPLNKIAGQGKLN